MSSNATHDTDTPTTTPAAHPFDSGDAIPGILNDIVVTHILRSQYFDDPADLARLRVVSRAMRDAVTATGLQSEEINACHVADLGCLSAVQPLDRRGLLSRQTLLCQAAASSGQLEELKALCADGCPWSENTCAWAAKRGHLEVIQWARANGCLWSNIACMRAAGGGQLEVLKWLRENGCPIVKDMCTCAAQTGNIEMLQ